MYGYMYNTLLSSFAYLATYVVVSVIQHSGTSVGYHYIQEHPHLTLFINSRILLASSVV